MTKRSWTDLYMHGERLSYISKSLYTQYKNAEEQGNKNMMLQWQEAFRKMTNSTVDVAKTVLAVEEIVKGKRIINA